MCIRDRHWCDAVHCRPDDLAGNDEFVKSDKIHPSSPQSQKYKQHFCRDLKLMTYEALTLRHRGIKKRDTASCEICLTMIIDPTGEEACEGFPESGGSTEVPPSIAKDEIPILEPQLAMMIAGCAPLPSVSG